MINRPWSDEFREAAETWCDLEAAAQALEDTKSSILSQKMAECGDVPVNRAEMTVKASAFWRDYIQKIVDARRLANIAKINMEVCRMKFSEWQNSEANNRAEMKMVNGGS